jgi:hypothetical protein
MQTLSAAPLVRAYADRFDRALSDGAQTIDSPLGAWLLLAVIAPAATGEDREALEVALGVRAEDASQIAHELLREPHPAVAAALAMWHRDELLYPSFSEWSRSLHDVAEIDRVPSQAEANRWAARATKGIIPEFPIELDETVAIVLANALATRIEWQHPFDLTSADRLGSPWSAAVSWALKTPELGHTMHIAATQTAGDVAVHATSSDDDMTVVSVIADPAVAPADVRGAALDVAGMVVGAPSTSRVLRLADLPLGDAPAWTIQEQRGSSATDTYHGYLPSWRGTSEHDLLSLDPSLGFAPACSVLSTFVKMPDPGFQAKQVAAADYERHGFEAAALTAMTTRGLAASPRPPMVQRHATLRFGHPYAVVAVTTDDRGGPWHGVPVFSAWVAEPVESGRT